MTTLNRISLLILLSCPLLLAAGMFAARVIRRYPPWWHDLRWQR